MNMTNQNSQNTTTNVTSSNCLILTNKDLAREPILLRLWDKFVIRSQHVRKPWEHSNNRQEEEVCYNSKHGREQRPVKHEVPASSHS